MISTSRLGRAAAPGRLEEGNGGLQPGAETDDPEDPSSRMHARLTAAQPAGLVLSL